MLKKCPLQKRQPCVSSSSVGPVDALCCDSQYARTALRARQGLEVRRYREDGRHRDTHDDCLQTFDSRSEEVLARYWTLVQYHIDDLHNILDLKDIADSILASVIGGHLSHTNAGATPEGTIDIDEAHDGIRIFTRNLSHIEWISCRCCRHAKTVHRRCAARRFCLRRTRNDCPAAASAIVGIKCSAGGILSDTASASSSKQAERCVWNST